jgi:hypothetical protein
VEDRARLAAADAGGPDVAPTQENPGVEEAGISAAERTEILGQIADLTRRRAQGRDTGVGAPQARRSGALLPALVDVASLLVLAAGAAFLFAFFDRKQDSLVSDTTRVLSAEARVVRAVREEARARLSAKDREISDIETRLDEVSRERERILADLEARVTSREQELEQAMGSELEALRGELRRRGTAERDIEAELAAVTAGKQRELDAVLSAFRDEARREVEERERAADELNGKLAASLQAARAERAALDARYGERTRELERERDTVAQGLRAAEESRERGELVRNQITASYEGVRREVEAGRYAGALAGLDRLEAYLGTALVAALPSFERNRGVELYLVDSLRELVGRRAADSSAAALAQAEAARLVRAASELVVRAEALRASGDLEGASKLFLAAVERIPETGRSHAWLEARRVARERAAVEAALGAGGGEPAGALEGYREAIVALGDEGARLYDAIVDAATSGYRETLGRKARLWEAQSAALAAMDAEVGAPAPRAEELDYGELLSLLEFKLRTMQLLLSEGVRGREPDLASGLERYLEALSRSRLEEGRAEGRAQATLELADALHTLREAGAAARVGSAGAGERARAALPPELVDELRRTLALAFE